MQSSAAKPEFDDKAQRPAKPGAPLPGKAPAAKVIYPNQPSQRSQ